MTFFQPPATVDLHLQIRFLADPSLAFTKGLDLSFDGASIFGGDRSKRYALVIEDGAVKEAHVESDNTGLNGMSDPPFTKSPLTRDQSLPQTRSCDHSLTPPGCHLALSMSFGCVDAGTSSFRIQHNRDWPRYDKTSVEDKSCRTTWN